MKQNKLDEQIRSWILIVLAVVIFGIYIFQLMQIQIVDAAKYQEMVQGITTSTQPIKAIRGEILDRNGRPLVQNEMSYDVILDKAFIPYGEENETILRLIGLFEEMGTGWIDNLPLSTTQPFAYLEGKEKEIETLHTTKDTQSYITADELMDWLIKGYKLEEFSKEDARKIAAVRYEMERKDFSNAIPYIFAENISNAMVITVKERSYELMGVDVVASGVRIYPDDTLAPHVLGLTGPLYQEEYGEMKANGMTFQKDAEHYDTRGYTLDDTIGKSGIEQAFEGNLRGSNGLREIQMDVNGQVVSVEEVISPKPGGSVVLTIDADLQALAEEALEAQIKHLNETQPAGRGGEAHSGAVVALRPDTGEILVAATYPSYSVGDYKENYTEVLNRTGTPLVNRAVQGQYTPGSIFKPVVALTGLHTGVITPTSTYFCGGRYHRFTPYTPKCLGVHGAIGVNNALAWSCNIFFYETGWHAGIDAIDDMSKSLGLGEPTGIEIPEAIGQRSNPVVKEARGGGEWYGADTIQTAIGQFDNRFTPLQLANYAATIANRGTRMNLTLLKEIRDFTTGDVLQEFSPQVTYEMSDVSPEHFETTIQGMISATTGSAGGTFGGYPIVVASKTGTPQVTEDVVNSTYIAFAPAENPQIVVAVVIEEGWQGYTGAPVAKAIFDDFFEVEHRGAVASGPQRLEDYRAANTTLGQSGTTSVMDAVFPSFVAKEEETSTESVEN